MEQRLKINIRDKNFVGDNSSCHKSNSQYIEWVRTNEPVSDTVVLTDLCLQDVYKATSAIKRKVAWILEPKAIHPHVYEWIEKNNRLFDYVLTFDKDLIAKGQNYLYYPHGRCWIDKQVVPQVPTKRVSIIASGKDFAPGHKLRHQVIKQLAEKHNIDVYGYGYKPVENKIDALAGYAFSITIENSIQPGYWTEKIVDCFKAGSIPLFWGDNSVEKYFSKDGIVYFNSVEHLDTILSSNLIEKYIQEWKTDHWDSDTQKLVNGMYSNHSLVEGYRVPEDWMYLNYKWLFT